MKKIILLTIGVLFIGGCVYSIIKNYRSTDPTMSNASINRTIGVYVDEEPKNPQNLKKIKIATITVATDGNLTLNILQPDNLQIKKLQEAVATMAATTTLTLTGENERVINGQKVLAMEAWQVEKEEPNYIYAVKETLATEFGFRSEIEKENNPLIQSNSATTALVNKITIGTGTQGQYGNDLRIGVGYVRREDYTDENKVSHTGRVAGLWLYVKDHSEQNKVIKVYIGQKFTIAEYAVTVINIGGGSGAVTLQFESLKK